MLVEALVVISLTLAIVYLVVYSMSGTSTYQGASAIYDLSKPNTKVLENSDMPWSNKPEALRFGIQLHAAPKTIQKVDCIDSTQSSSFGPSCENYEFKVCACQATDCSRCSMGNTYLSRLLNIGDFCELWASGYTNQNDKPFVPAILKIKTVKDPSAHFVESVSLPAIPLQKWTIITIVKEGRRIDVYYGSKLVASKLLTYLPLHASGQYHWFAGHSQWKGKIGFFYGTKGMVKSSDIDADLKSLVNTRGVPFYLDQLTISWDDFTLPECMFGLCNTTPTVKPRNPFAVYQSNVA
jgi:hypothetical protein